MPVETICPASENVNGTPALTINLKISRVNEYLIVVAEF